MPISSGELIAFSSTSRPTDDVSTTGGSIDTTNRATFSQISGGSAALEAVSSNGGDTTQIVTVFGRNAAGEEKTSTVTLTGTSAAQLSPATVFERVLYVSLNGAAAGTVTVRKTGGGATIGAIPAGELGFSAMFIKAASAASPTVRYEKFFWQNTNGSLSLTTAAVELTADPSSKIEIGLATAINDSGTVANRLAAPGGVSFVDDSVSQSVPGGTLAAGDKIGVWIKLSLDADNAPLNSSFTTQLSGLST